MSLTSGVNTIEFLARNRESVGAVGGEISGPFEKGSLDTEAAQKTADYQGKIIFSTRSLVGASFTLGEMTGWRCRGDDEVLNTCHGAPRCSTIERAACMLPPAQCGPGTHDVDGQCIDNECVCAFGLPAVGAACPEHGEAGCRACFSGYTLDNGVCRENECTCENGVPGVSAACTEDGAEICLVCDDGYG